MKKYMLIALISVGLLGSASLYAQDVPGAKTEKKERKMEKKGDKMKTKEYNGNERKSVRKREKTMKKADRAGIKDEKGK